VCKCTFNHYPIIPIRLLYEKFTLYSRFDDVFLLRRLRDISNKAGGHLKNSGLLVFNTCCMAFLWAGRPSYRLQFPANVVLHYRYVCRKYALSCQVLYYRYVRVMQLKGVMHQLQPSLSHFPCLSIPEDQPITAQSLDRR
jgi:hypothetical protein